MSRAKTFTHVGRLLGDARAGGRKPLVRLRLTPSGSHWVDQHGCRYRASNGWGAGDWPMWSLDVKSIQPASALEARRGETGTGSTAEGSDIATRSEAKGDAQ